MRVIGLTVLILMAFAIACGEPDRTTRPTAAPLPTYTPYPTYTPLPTHTSLPTPTLTPTRISTNEAQPLLQKVENTKLLIRHTIIDDSIALGLETPVCDHKLGRAHDDVFGEIQFMILCTADDDLSIAGLKGMMVLAQGYKKDTVIGVSYSDNLHERYIDLHRCAVVIPGAGEPICDTLRSITFVEWQNEMSKLIEKFVAYGY